MKKLIIVVASLMVAVGAYGQGQFFFSNRDTTATPPVTARFFLPSDPQTSTGSSVGTDYTVTLLGGPKGTSINALKPLDQGSSTVMRGAAGTTLAGYVSPVTFTVTGVDAGASADILVKVSGPGGTFSQVFNVPSLGGGTVTPPTLPMGATALLLTPVPEPTTLALGALGLGALLAIRRRK
jgi:MYXO-CTERM domain-containing protein